MATKLSERLIAFLDILGFSQRLLTESLDDLHERYSALVDSASKTVFAPPSVLEHDHGTPQPHFDYAGFHSDSVVLVSQALTEDAAPKSAFNFVGAIAQLLENGFARCLPFRGSIGLGNVLIDEERRILLSETLPSLLALEKDQDWSGCVVHPDAEQRVLDHIFGTEVPSDHQGLLVRFPVSLKTHPALDRGLCVNWVSFLSEREIETGLAFLKGTKLDKTRQFVNHVKSLPDGATLQISMIEPGITAIRMMPSRSGMRVKFMNDRGEGIDLQGNVTLEIKILGGSPTSP